MYLKFAPNTKKIKGWETPANFENDSSETKVAHFFDRKSCAYSKVRLKVSFVAPSCLSLNPLGGG